jgi:tRNA dimethylallyltransferase
LSSAVLALAGPTASGKSAAALAVARALAPHRRVEIISVDSALVYRGMDIGTAKPTAAEQAEVRHHLLDLIDPAQAYSAARFLADAKVAIAEIQRRGALPLLVGGTMLYLKALRDGLDAMPAADAAVRAALDDRAARVGWPALHAELAQVDPITAARLPPNDAQRIQRALEVWQLTGKPLSHWHAGPAQPAPGHGEAQALPGVDLRLIALEPTARSWLHERIAQRFDAMLAAGFVREVQTLRQRGDLHAGLPSMRCVGYRQAWQALEHDEALAPGSSGWAAFREAGIAATRQLAKRQLTWLRSMPQRQVVACDGPGAVAQVIEAVKQPAQGL